MNWNTRGNKDRKIAIPVVLLGAMSVAVLLPFFSGIPQSQPQNPSLLPGQSATLLPDGRLLLLGGENFVGTSGTISMWNPRTGATTNLQEQLRHPRAWHTATILPNGTVLIFGGVEGNGQLVHIAEVFDPESQTLSEKPLPGLSSRARHTATLLTDAHVLFAGGGDSNGQTLATAELWDALGNAPVFQLPNLATPRRGHTANLTDQGTVLLSGGLAPDGSPLDIAELFDPVTEQFSFVDAATLTPPSGNPVLMSSIPAHNATDVDRDTLITFRFSKPLRVETVSSQTVTLIGPCGIEAAKIVPAEAGMLAFMTPETELLPGATYSVSVNGAVDRDGLLLPVSGISFSTKPSDSSHPSDELSSSPSLQPETRDTKPETASQAQDDDWEWKGAKKNGKPYSPWQDLPPFQAAPGVTALAGQVLTLKGEPLTDVTLEMLEQYGSGKTSTKTDESGRFLLENVQSGWNTLIIDGQSANRSGKTYGVFKVGVEIKTGQTNVLSYTIWMPRIDTAHAVKVPSPTVSEFAVTTPHIPGLELLIPAGAVLYDHQWNVVNEISITPIPVDRPPFPLPDFRVPAYFTIQPGGGYLYTAEGKGARLIYPNYNEMPVSSGGRFSFWHYKPGEIGWHIYGLGRVTDGGKQVVPDAGVGIYQFTGAMINDGNTPPDEGPPCSSECGRDGDPVDLYTGLFLQSETDLSLPDIMSLALTRTYRPRDPNSRPFGIGATHPYAMFLWSANSFFEADLILPDGGRVHFDCIPTANCTTFRTAVLEHTATPSKFHKARMKWNGNGWDIKLKDGTVYVFGENAPLQAIRDRYGNQITLTRTAGQRGNITKITSPHARWIELSYDANNRITQAKDHIGRIVTYTYDAMGRLWKVTDPNSGVTEFTYDAAHRMLTVKNPRLITVVNNAYDSDGKVQRQTLANSGTYQFSYATDANGRVVQTDVTNPRAHVRRVTFNSSGYVATETRALGQAEEQTLTYERQAGTNITLSTIDALNRKTAYTYDSMGNVLTITRLADTPEAVTTTYTYEPTLNQVETITDALNHTTTFSYDAQGNLTSTTNPLNQTTTMAYNSKGQLISVTDPLNHTTRFAYELGDLAAVTDPLGNTTTRFTDWAGRLANVTTPLGQVTRYDYDVLNRLTKVTDPLLGITEFTHDPNGNLLTVKDARNNTTTYAYNNVDHLQTREDPLLKNESYQYDLNRNLSRFIDRKQQQTTYTHDALNRRSEVTYADGSTTAYTYDAGNRLAHIVDSISGAITRTYDGLDRLTSETTPQGSVTYTYDAVGRRTSMTVSGQPSVVYIYDNADRLLQITQGSAVVSFTYDNANRRTSFTLPNGVLVEYGYDAASRVTNITYKQNGTTVLGDLTYEYDKNGNRTKIGGSFARTGIPQNVDSTSYNAANQQLTFGDKILTYDDNGNLTSITDTNGTTLYTWNSRNQLTAISSPNVTATFVYDGLGRRQKKTINGNLTEFLYDGVNPVRETSGATVLTNLITGLTIDEFFARIDASGTQSLLPDALGSIISLTSSSGAIETEYTYEPFGRTTSTGASNANPFQYTARENDGTDLYYYRARYYHPRSQRFIGEDPVRFSGGDWNLYAYVANEPTDLKDPLGLQFRPPTPFVPRPTPQGEALHGLSELLDDLRQREEKRSEWNEVVDFLNEIDRKLREAGNQFECDRMLIVCYHLRSPRGTVRVLTAIHNLIPGGYVCFSRLAVGLNRNCCSIR